MHVSRNIILKKERCKLDGFVISGHSDHISQFTLCFCEIELCSCVEKNDRKNRKNKCRKLKLAADKIKALAEQRKEDEAGCAVKALRSVRKHGDTHLPVLAASR